MRVCMFLCAMRVRSKTGEEGVNAFHYIHEDADWLPFARDVKADCGALVVQSHEVKPGGNEVLSYLDIVGPDDLAASIVETCLFVLVHLGLRDRRPFPWHEVFGMQQCGLRVAMTKAIGQKTYDVAAVRKEIACLLKAAMEVRVPLEEASRLLAKLREGKEAKA